MTDTHVAIQAHHVTGMKDIAHKTVILAQVQATPVRGDNSCSILSTMLQYGETVINILVDRTASNDSYDAAHKRFPEYIS